MTDYIQNNLYGVAIGTTTTNPFVTHFDTRNPTVNDVNYPVQKRWFNTNLDEEWILVSFTTIGGVYQANWQPISSSSPVETLTGNSGGAVGPNGSSTIFVLGDETTINIVGTPVDNTLTASLVGGAAVQSVEVDTNTAPGTNPVVADSTGQITVTGGQVAAGTTGNTILTKSVAAHQYTIEVQRSQAVASSTVGDNGVSHYSNAYFSLDSNAFVTGVTYATDSGTATPASASVTVHGTNGITTSGSGHTITISGAGTTDAVVRQVFTTTGTYTPTAGMLYCDIEVVGGGGGSGGIAATGATQNSCSAGGGGGGYARGIFSAATIGASKSVTIGAGGTAGTAGNNTGGTGGTTSVGVLISATGGLGGGGGPAVSSGSYFCSHGGVGGAGSGGDYQTNGGAGGSTTQIGFVLGIAGFGGSTFFGGNALGADNATAIAGLSFGGGASGSSQGQNFSAQVGAAGAAGIVIITEYVG